MTNAIDVYQEVEMRSAEFYQAFGHDRHEELLREAHLLRAARVPRGRGLFDRLIAVLRRKAGRPGAPWAESTLAGKPAHG